MDETLYLPSTTKLRQGNIFTGFCQSFCSQGGGCLPQCILGYTHPPDQTTGEVSASVHAGIYSPWADTPLAVTAADGTHPTGMHSCCSNISGGTETCP